VRRPRRCVYLRGRFDCELPVCRLCLSRNGETQRPEKSAQINEIMIASDWEYPTSPLVIDA
jgi:hypothetical protein